MSMSLLKNRQCALTEQILVTSLLIKVVTCFSIDVDSIDNFDYEDYYNSYPDWIYPETYDEPAIVNNHTVKLGDAVMLSCPNHTKIWKTGNGTFLGEITLANGPDHKNVTVSSEDDAGYYDCFDPSTLFFNSHPVLRHRIFISSETTITSIEPESTTSMNIETKLKNTKAMAVDSEYFLASLLSSTSGNSNKSVFQTLTNGISSSVAAKNWYILYPIIISLFYKFYQ